MHVSVQGRDYKVGPIRAFKVWTADHRPHLLKKLRCLTGFHNPPTSEAFEEYGVIYIGGVCTSCNDVHMISVIEVFDIFRDRRKKMRRAT